MPETTELNAGTAQTEANIVVSITKPIAEEAIKRAATPGSPLEKALPKFGDTTYIELGSQVLQRIKEEQPNLYATLVTREETFARLVKAVYPGYIDLKEKHYIPPAQRRAMAEKAPEEARKKALKKARDTAGVIVNSIVREVENSKPDHRIHPANQDYVVATRAILKELEDGHFINGDNTQAITNLLGCTLATVQTNRLLKKLNMKLEFNLGDALGKQLKFYKAQESP